MTKLEPEPKQETAEIVEAGT